MHSCSCCMEDFLTHAPCLKRRCCRTGPLHRVRLQDPGDKCCGAQPMEQHRVPQDGLRTSHCSHWSPCRWCAYSLLCPRSLVVISALAHQHAAPQTQFGLQGPVKHCSSEASLAVAHAGSSSTSILTCWGTPANDYGAPITAYHLEVSPVPPRQKSAPAWQRAYSGIATTCEVPLFSPPCHLPLHCLHCP